LDDLSAMLSKILEDPESMNQLKAAAAALGLNPDGPPPPGFGTPAGGQPEAAPAGQAAPQPAAPQGSGQTAPPAGQAMPDLSALAALLGVQQQPQQPAVDPAALRLIQGAVAKLNERDKNIELLRALKPHFSPARSSRVDNAIRLMQLFAMLPVLRDSGVLGDLGRLDLGSLGALGSLLGGGRRP